MLVTGFAGVDGTEGFAIGMPSVRLCDVKLA